MKIFAVLVSVALIASVSAQNDIMRMYMMMQLLGSGSGSSSSASSRAASNSGITQQSYSTGNSGRGGGVSISPLLLMGGGNDRIRDIMMCNMIGGPMRMMCYTRAFQ